MSWLLAFGLGAGGLDRLASEKFCQFLSEVGNRVLFGECGGDGGASWGATHGARGCVCVPKVEVKLLPSVTRAFTPSCAR